jgi:hypothetical protein
MQEGFLVEVQEQAAVPTLSLKATVNGFRQVKRLAPALSVSAVCPFSALFELILESLVRVQLSV